MRSNEFGSGPGTGFRRSVVIACGMLLLLLLPPLQAEVKIELDETEITGARELPKVLYVVPWKQTAPDPRPLPMRSLVQELLAPVDMDEFRREVRYSAMTSAPAPAPPAETP